MINEANKRYETFHVESDINTQFQKVLKCIQNGVLKLCKYLYNRV